MIAVKSILFVQIVLKVEMIIQNHVDVYAEKVERLMGSQKQNYMKFGVI